MKRRIGLVAAALVALIVLAGCNLGAKVVVEPDGSGYYTVVMTVPDAPSHPGRAIYAALSGAAAQSNVPLTVQPYNAAGNTGATLTYHFLSLADLDAESHRLAASGKGGIGVTVTRDASGWHFSGSTAGSLIDAPGSTSSSGSPALRNIVNQAINIDLIVQLPGVPAENNAKSVTHTATTSTFSWVLASSQLGSGLQASTTFVGNQANVKLAGALTPVLISGRSGGSSGLSAGTIALIAVGGAVIVFGVAAAVVLARRRKAVPAVEDAATAD